MSDQERISPYIGNTISSRQVMRIKNKFKLGNLEVHPKPNSPNEHQKSCMADSKENY